MIKANISNRKKEAGKQEQSVRACTHFSGTETPFGGKRIHFWVTVREREREREREETTAGRHEQGMFICSVLFPYARGERSKDATRERHAKECSCPQSLR